MPIPIYPSAAQQQTAREDAWDQDQDRGSQRGWYLWNILVAMYFVCMYHVPPECMSVLWVQPCDLALPRRRTGNHVLCMYSLI